MKDEVKKAKRLFDRVLKKPFKEPLLNTPSLPSDLSYANLEYRTKRGFLAKKICQYLQLNQTDGDSLFYLSHSRPSFLDTNKEDQGEVILCLCELMLVWNDRKLDIPEQIKGMEIRSDIQNALLKAYEMFKDEMFRNSQESDVQECKKEIEAWEVYRDVIYAATQEKFLLINKDEISEYQAGEVLCQEMIKKRSDIPRCREKVKVSLEDKKINGSAMMGLLLVLSEAITNTIKHAEEGKMTLIEEGNEIRFIIEDKGPGFSLKDLPKLTLLAGYSTKRSMGQGFTLMMKMAKQVILYTSNEGSTLILTFDVSNPTDNVLVG
ncbi:anti-sigma regulatory factor (Ser/Thr protein kinase) [Evansella vedderi]|uniref:Anti-sigma regulatory factor (Ser/Thr protein kinase) n=1 Tax=Evansella vedderi TaxID=38282 RepID=A0ABT9ZP93_9BACI|nr:ATP-binding protein [Evansella vedderi]MDQ0253057.1 anti-sigma regulatory factor (Ser/Thr protein kinase) [Evansella vedderi]